MKIWIPYYTAIALLCFATTAGGYTPPDVNPEWINTSYAPPNNGGPSSGTVATGTR